MTDTSVNHSERAHALCSASGAERWLNCPGSVAMSLQVPEPPSSKYALEGTKMHELCELLMFPLATEYNKTKGKKVRPLAEVIKDLPETVMENYPLEMREYAEDFIARIWKHVESYRPKKICIEEKVFLDKDLAMFGTADLFFGFVHKNNKKVLAIYDIKYGKGKVVEADAPQLIFYALAVQATHPKTQFDEYWLHIYQPRAEHESGSMRRHVMPKEEAAKWHQKFISGAAIALDMLNKPEEKFKLKAGEHCIFCNAKPVCKVYAQYLNTQAGLDFTDDPAVLVPAIPEQRYEIQEFMSDEKISKLLTHRKEIEKFLSSLTEYAINRFQEGNPIPGWKVVSGRSMRKWSDEVSISAGLKKLGIKDPWDKKLRGIGSIERELKAIHDETKETKKTKKEISALIQPLTRKTTPPKTLVPEDDERPAIDVSADAAQDFKAIEQKEEEMLQEDFFDTP